VCGSPEKQNPPQRWRAVRGQKAVRADGLTKAQKGTYCKLGLPGASGCYLVLAKRYAEPFLGWWGGLRT
jgi:hypothetical protein